MENFKGKGPRYGQHALRVNNNKLSLDTCNNTRLHAYSDLYSYLFPFSINIKGGLLPLELIRTFRVTIKARADIHVL